MNKSEKRLPVMPIIVTIILAIGIMVSFIVAGTRQLNETESLLLGIILSSASIMVSWLVTHIYSQISFSKTIEQATKSNNENIKNYAVKAAEKVLNLSSQLKRLSEALSNAIDDSEDMSNHKEAVMILQERISSAVHNIQTLRSMNDTFLSDWRGVIGEEIEKQQFLENQLGKLSDELDDLKNERETLKNQFVSPEDLMNVEKLISKTEERITSNISELPFKVVSTKQKTKKRLISVRCPSCEGVLSTKFRLKKGARKLEQCTLCEQYIKIVGLDDEEIQITPIAAENFEGNCPICNDIIKSEIASYPGAIKKLTCVHCNSSIFLSKTQDSINIRSGKGDKNQISQKIIDKVRAKLPKERPWPTHIHKQIAKELGCSNGLVSRVISGLISEGLYPLPQEVVKIENHE